MEQSIADGETISYLEFTVPVKFFRGCYSCEGVKGSFSTLENLKNAWVSMLRRKKLTELRGLAKRLKQTTNRKAKKYGYCHQRNYLYKEMERWQIKTLGK